MNKVYALCLGWRNIDRHLILGMDGVGSIVLNYYMWVIRGQDKYIVVDTGFDVKEAEKRGVKDIVDPRIMLARLGINNESVHDVIVSHLHWDHFGGWRYFPNAIFYVQKKEIECMRNDSIVSNERVKRFYTNMEEIELLSMDGRIKTLEDESIIGDGVTSFWVGGHTPGCQAVEVKLENQRKTILAVDSSFYLENYEKRIPPLLSLNTIEAIEAFEVLSKRIGNEQVVLIPGHDPGVMSQDLIASGVVGIR